MGQKLIRLVWSIISFLMAAPLSAAVDSPPSGISHFYGTEQLSSNLINSLCQDKQGYIWISTEYGLNRFDGLHFSTYYADDLSPQPLLSNNCRRVICDGDGQVWAISYKGIQRYDRLTNSFPVVRMETDSLSYPTDMMVMRDGRLLVLTIKNGLYLLNPKQMRAEPWVEANKLYVDSAASCMLEDSHGRIWIGSDRYGLTLLDIKSNKSLHFGSDQLKSKGVNAVCEDGKGRVIVLSRSKVLLYEETTRQLKPIGETNGLYLRNLFRTRKGEVLLATYGNGLLKVDVEGNQLIPMFQQTLDGGIRLNHVSVQSFLEDVQGNIWIGCFRNGLAFLSNHKQPFSHFTLDTLPGNNSGVLSYLSFNQQGHWLIGQENNGLTEVSTDNQPIGQRFPGHYVLGYLNDKQNSREWIGTYGQGAFVTKSGSSSLAIVDSLRDRRVKDILTDSSGNVYLAVFDYGLVICSANGSQQLINEEGSVSLHNRYLNKLFLDSKGLLWIGHYNGIDVYDTRNHRMADIPVDNVLRPLHTFAITESRDGLVWVGTSQGLFCYTPASKSWQQLTKSDGLPNEIICGIVEDDNGDLWLSTYRGLCHLLRKSGKVLNYYHGDGLESASYLRGIYGKRPDGIVYFGHDHGFTYFNPSEVKGYEFKNGVTLTGLFVAGREQGTDGEHIKLDYQNNTFTLRFSTMDYREAGNVQYEYRFSDESKDVWHQLPAGVSDMILSHLRFGTHLLQVRAQDNGIYSPVKQILIEITPPWYRSWWAYIIYALAATGIIIMLFLNIRHKQLADMNEEKIKFFVDISHELRSPLTLIKSPLEMLLRKENDPVTQRALLNMQRNTDRLLLLFNQILSIRKIEKGQMKLHYAETNLKDFVAGICQAYDYLREKRQLKANLKTNDDTLKVWIDREYFDKVINNLLTNAMKHIDDGGEVEVEICHCQESGQKACAEIIVRDDGPGIDEAYLQQVFQRFYQTSVRPKAGQVGYGIGLNLSQKLVTLHGGTISARNRSDKQGSEFVVRLPLGNAHLPKEQLVDEAYFAGVAEKEQDAPALATDLKKPRRIRKRTNYHIAVVDDEEEIRNFLQTELGESYQVQTYSDGKKALEGIVEDVPDLVISDIIMPEIDGFTLLRRLKNNTKTSHIPVVLLTTKNEHQSRIEGLDQGADAYVNKPFNLEELEARVAGLIGNRIRVRGKFTGAQEQEETVRQIELKGINEEMMEKVMKFINENLDDSEFNVEALADKIGMSRAQLHRRVKEATGISVGEFIRNLRLKQAARLLEKGDTTIQQVAWAVGFSNPTHFSAAFKRYFGVPPQEYVAKRKSETKS